MRRLITILAAVIVMAASVQAEHLKFKDIAIDGPIGEFEAALAAKGYVNITPEGTTPDTMCFTDPTDPMLFLQVIATPKSHTTRRVDAKYTLEAPLEGRELEEIMNVFCNHVESQYTVEKKKVPTSGEVIYDIANKAGSVSLKIDGSILEISFIDGANLMLDLYERNLD